MEYVFVVRLTLEHDDGPKASGAGLAGLLAESLDANLPSSLVVGGSDYRDATTFALKDSIVVAIAS